VAFGGVWWRWLIPGSMQDGWAGGYPDLPVHPGNHFLDCLVTKLEA
jgi:hypothetical protein